MPTPQTVIRLHSQKPMSPIPLYQAALLFAIASSGFFCSFYILLPWLRRNSFSWFACFNLALVVPVFALLACAMLGYVSEKQPFRWASLCDRFRLHQMDRSSWIWTAGLAFFMFGGKHTNLAALACALLALSLDSLHELKDRFVLSLSVAAFLILSWFLSQTRSFFIAIPLHSLPTQLQQFESQLSNSHVFMAIPLRHHWWIALYYACIFMTGNILGEELLWRGFLLPRQETASGQVAWLYNGLLWAGFHLFAQATAWDLIHMIPTCCALAFVAQYRQNTWPGIIAHFVGNAPILIGIIQGVMS